MATNLVDIAIELSERWHEGQYRYDGSEYILHPRRVAKKLLEHGYDDDVTQCEAYLHDTVEMAPRGLATRRMREIYRIFGHEIGYGVFVLSENMGGVGKAIAVKTDAFKQRLINSREDIQRVKVADFLDNSTDLKVYLPVNRIRRINEAYDFYIPLARRVAPTIADELIEIIEAAKAKFT